MRNLSQDLLSAISGNTITLATCCKIHRKDSTVLLFTDCSEAITYKGERYEPSYSMTPSTIENYACLLPNTLSIEGFINDESITANDIMLGKYDGATVRIFVLDYSKPELGEITIKCGTIGSVSIYDNTFVANISSISENMNVLIGSCYSYKCRAQLGDDKCKINLQDFSQLGIVEQVNGGNIFIDTKLTQSEGYFNYGTVKFITGNNKGTALDIARHDQGGIIELYLSLHHPIGIGDEYQIVAGCNKLLSECQDKFNNTVNFRGEPHIKSSVQIYDKVDSSN